MGVLQYFDVILEDNPSGVYFPGDVVKGRIKYGLEEEQKTKGMFFIIQQSIINWNKTNFLLNPYS